VEVEAREARIVKIKNKKKKKQKKKRAMEVKKVVEEWEIWNKEDKAVKLEKEAKKLVPLKFYEWIHVFEKKVSEKMLMRKIWDHTIITKEGLIPRKGKVYLLSREEKEEVCEFIEEQLRKEYIRPLKLP